MSFTCSLCVLLLIFFFFNDTATTEIYTLSLHDALPISIHAAEARHADRRRVVVRRENPQDMDVALRHHFERQGAELRSEEHTSELQSQSNLVCRLLLEKKKKKNTNINENDYRR